ncbi:Gfo/Idh/MocA family protein [Rathayibacter soli]|uniref:Gfo/Idh/MocA family protein n=1 Tax=Rathayibacter soli TaxID=3144168 RepID=UPI0027E4D1E8|nr:Gfo/Idh/MocA family oxidoreductase [Glaciibacter superstes]
MTNSLRWGILATGGIAHTFARDLTANGFRLQAVGSRSPQSANAFAAEFGIPTAHASYEALVADPDVDIVYVATPHPLHVANASLALNAGKHVLVEKPLTINALQAQQLADLAAEKHLLLLEAMWTRFLPHIARIDEIIAAGTLGRLLSFSAEHAQKLPDDPAHRINALELGGGALLDLGVYPISFAAHLFGEPESVRADARFRDTGADSAVATVFRYAGGGLATTFSASDTRGANRAVIEGADARIEIDAVWYAPTDFRVIANSGDVLETYESDVVGGKQFQAVEAERLIAQGLTASPLMRPDESVSIMRTLDEIRSQIGLVYPGE